MEKVVTYNLSDDPIRMIGEFVEENFLDDTRDLSRLAIVFGGKRPSLFLKRELSKRIKKSFFPPAFFSIDEFVEYILSREKNIRSISELDACYMIYKLVKKISPDVLRGREDFSRFLPWAREILSFIELLDLEGIEAEALENIKMNAAIGYEVPESINTLLKHTAAVRDAYHSVLKKEGIYSRGLMYLGASEAVKDMEVSQFEQILFCNFFYLHRTEERILKYLYDSGKALLFFQGSGKEWPVLSKISRSLSCRIEPPHRPMHKYNISIYAGSDMHSEVCLVREILKKIENPENTVIVLPDSDSIVPLLSEITCLAKEFNVSMGYPLKRSSLYTLFESIFSAQRTKKGTGYYVKEYLKVLSHPFVKNLKILEDPSITRVLVHKIEEVLAGIEETRLSGNLFVTLKDIEGLKELYSLSALTMKNMDIEVTPQELQSVLKEIHSLLFYSWEDIRDFSAFSHTLETFLDTLLDKSPLSDYPINLKIIEKLFRLREEFSNALFTAEHFSSEDIFKIFLREIESQVISFSGSPLRGLQVLGLFETRSLAFENVIILDVNESVLPRLSMYEPLIPREVVISLGINRIEEEEEIQRYQFMRLINSSKNVFLVYGRSKERARSRFIEELIWEKEREAGSVGVVPLEMGSFQVKILPEKARIYKSADELKFLKEFRFSPTSLNTYLRCPQSFYYQYVLGLKEKEDFFEEPEGLHVGKFIHSLLEETFKRFEGRKPVIDKEFRKSFFEIFSYRFNDFFVKRMKRDSFLLKEVMRFRLEKFLDKEEKRGVEELVSLESKFDSEIEMGGRPVRVTSRVDRIDRLMDRSLFIIDYKTGGDILIPKDIKKMEVMEFTRDSIKDTIRSFQLPLYLYLVRHAYKGYNVRSCLYSLRDLKIETFPKEKKSDTLEQALDICIKAVEYIICEIVDPETPFVAQKLSQYCNNCPFFYMCR